MFRNKKMYDFNGLGRFYLPAILLYKDNYIGETVVHIRWCHKTMILIFRDLKKNPYEGCSISTKT